MKPNDDPWAAVKTFNDWFDGYLKKKEVDLANKKKNEDICGFCGPYEECHEKYHTKEHLRDLLVDAGIIADTDHSFMVWWISEHPDNDPKNMLLGYEPKTLWEAGYKYPAKLAKYVRSIL